MIFRLLNYPTQGCKSDIADFRMAWFFGSPDEYFYKYGLHNVCDTTLQSMVNAKLSPHRFWHCHENGHIKTIPTIPHNLYVSFKLTSLYFGLRLILVYPNP